MAGPAGFGWDSRGIGSEWDLSVGHPGHLDGLDLRGLCQAGGDAAGRERLANADLRLGGECRCPGAVGGTDGTQHHPKSARSVVQFVGFVPTAKGGDAVLYQWRH